MFMTFVLLSVHSPAAKAEWDQTLPVLMAKEGKAFKDSDAYFVLVRKIKNVGNSAKTIAYWAKTHGVNCTEEEIKETLERDLNRTAETYRSWDTSTHEKRKELFEILRDNQYSEKDVAILFTKMNVANHPWTIDLIRTQLRGDSPTRGNDLIAAFRNGEKKQVDYLILINKLHKEFRNLKTVVNRLRSEGIVPPKGIDEWTEEAITSYLSDYANLVVRRNSNRMRFPLYFRSVQNKIL
jgi:hypothetical protein